MVVCFSYLIALSLQEESHAAANSAPPPQLSTQSSAAPQPQELKE